MEARDVIYVVAMNDYDIYKKVEWLKNCVRKRLLKGQQVTSENLRNCSTMKAITLAAKRIEEKYGGKITKDERELGAIMIADRIIEMAQEC